MAEEMKGGKVGGAGKVAEIDGGYFGGYVKPRGLAENRIHRRLARNQSGKRKVVVIVRERGGNLVRQSFAARDGRSLGSRRVSKREPSSTPTKLHHGTGCTALSKCGGSIIKRRTALTAPAPIGPRNISAACAVRKRAIIIISLARICFAMRRKAHGVRIIAGFTTEIRLR